MDDKTQTGAADRSRINVNEDYELAYWTRTLEVPEDELTERGATGRHFCRGRQEVSGTTSSLVDSGDPALR